MPSSDETCRHCGGDTGVSMTGFCEPCNRKGTVVLSRKRDGTYQCGLCTLAGRETDLEVSDRVDHLRTVHGIESGDRMQTIREHERLNSGKSHRQAGLGEVV